MWPWPSRGSLVQQNSTNSMGPLFGTSKRPRRSPQQPPAATFGQQPLRCGDTTTQLVQSTWSSHFPWLEVNYPSAETSLPPHGTLLTQAGQVKPTQWDLQGHCVHSARAHSLAVPFQSLATFASGGHLPSPSSLPSTISFTFILYL